MTRDIISKLTRELDTGIETEVQVVYLLVGVRKLIERDRVKDQYPDLKFYCDWALHPHMDRAAAEAILKNFDAAHPLLRGNIRLHELPDDLRSEIDQISKMGSFKRDLSRFLAAYELPPMTQKLPDGWSRFLYLYSGVIEDIPLVVSSPAATKHISHVTVHLERAQEAITENVGEMEMLYKVTWTIHDKNGETGDVFVINSFTSRS
jgi:hypothetical protein